MDKFRLVVRLEKLVGHEWKLIENTEAVLFRPMASFEIFHVLQRAGVAPLDIKRIEEKVVGNDEL